MQYHYLGQVGQNNMQFSFAIRSVLHFSNRNKMTSPEQNQLRISVQDALHYLAMTVSSIKSVSNMHQCSNINPYNTTPGHFNIRAWNLCFVDGFQRKCWNFFSIGVLRCWHQLERRKCPSAIYFVCPILQCTWKSSSTDCKHQKRQLNRASVILNTEEIHLQAWNKLVLHCLRNSEDCHTAFQCLVVLV